jgi:UDP-N-acetylmuramate dehydrogenase
MINSEHYTLFDKITVKPRLTMPFEHYKEVDLSSRNTLGLPSVSQYLGAFHSVSDLQHAFEFARNLSLPCFVMGGGSNILLPEYLPGLALLSSDRSIDIMGDEVTVGAGASWDNLVAETLKNGLFGLENLSSIPGTAGAAPIQNIGAYGVELARFVVSVEALDLQNGLAVTLTVDDCQFEYRDSLFKRHPERFVVTRLTLKLSTRFAPILAYQDLQRLPAQITESAEGLRRAIQSIRAKKLPDYRVFGNVGSFFKNPTLMKSVIQTLEQAQVLNSNTRSAQGKVSAAALIQAAELGDLSVGQAGISPKHHLVLENRGGATLTDILTLAHLIQEKVERRFGVTLEIEPQHLTQLIHAPNPKG